MASPLTTIANMFRPVQQTTQVAQQPMAVQNPGAAAQPPAAGTSQPTSEQAPANPLDEFTPLWQNDPNAQQRVDPLSTPLFNSDPAKIAAAAAKMDFVGQIPAEVLQKAMQDPNALVQLLNGVAQRTLATATQLNASTIEQATTRNNARVMSGLPERVRQIQLNGMQPDNPTLQHPAAQPFLQLMRSQIQMKNPGMSAVEINSQAERALTGFANQLVAAPASEAAARSSAGGTDWDAWAALS